MREVVILNFGTSLGKKSERLVIKEQGRVVEEIPFRDIASLTIATRGVSLSSDVVAECVEAGVQINFLTSGGRPYAKITSPQLTGTVITRREQILAYLDHRGPLLAKAFVEGKLKNQVNVLKYFAKSRRTQNPSLYEELNTCISRLEKISTALNEVFDGGSQDPTGAPLALPALPAPSARELKIDEVRGQLFSIEGRAAQEYWAGVGLLLEKKVDFEGREGRGATDPVNSALNYGYGILYSQVWGAVMLAGLEPFAGYLHTDRPGKPSLVLDLTEEFRPCVVDRTILAHLLRGGKIEVDEGRLEDKSRRELARWLLERLDNEEPFEGKKYRLRAIIQRQARQLATFLRGEGKYRPFIGSW